MVPIVEQTKHDLEDNPPSVTPPVPQDLVDRSHESVSPSPQAPHMLLDHVDMMPGPNSMWFNRYPYLVIDQLTLTINSLYYHSHDPTGTSKA